MTNKKFWESKTFWANVFVIAGGVITAIAGELQTGGTITAIGVLNIVLRILTKNPIKM